MQQIYNLIESFGVIPVITLDEMNDARLTGEALIAGGLPVAEITFRTDAAAPGLKEMHRHCDLLLGAGTVLTETQVEAAAAAGATFIVSPGFNKKITRLCLSMGLTPIPGVSTASEIEAALDEGVRVLKFFPAQAAGGPAMIKALAAPYGDVRFIPTGGINHANLRTYLDTPGVTACGGSWIASREDIRNRRFEEISLKAARAVHTITGLTYHRLLIPTSWDEETNEYHRVRRDALLWGVPLRAYEGDVPLLEVESSDSQRLIDHWKRQNLFLDPETGIIDDERRDLKIKLKGFPLE